MDEGEDSKVPKLEPLTIIYCGGNLFKLLYFSIKLTYPIQNLTFLSLNFIQKNPNFELETWFFFQK